MLNNAQLRYLYCCAVVAAGCVGSAVMAMAAYLVGPLLRWAYLVGKLWYITPQWMPGDKGDKTNGGLGRLMAMIP